MLQQTDNYRSNLKCWTGCLTRYEVVVTVSGDDEATQMTMATQISDSLDDDDGLTTALESTGVTGVSVTSTAGDHSINVPGSSVPPGAPGAPNNNDDDESDNMGVYIALFVALFIFVPSIAFLTLKVESSPCYQLVNGKSAKDQHEHDSAAEAVDDMRQQRTDYSETAVSNPVVQPAPTIWDEQVDPQSGRTYYINKSTAQAQWERPAEMDAPRAAAVSQASIFTL